ncbi:aldehyde dehydrogenase family protein [Sphingobium sp.]|uniref:aldehyde dehydrogenase family protein n=1 Tax=Sphingobium sp. TaxID=1912891 RepID=UPI0028BEB9E3|nr:aldehyde dehydrogenase family protein [Sphingobium sp.]
MTIDGIPVISPQTLPVINPATGQEMARAPDCTYEHVDAAVLAARRAFPAWRALSTAERSAMLRTAAIILSEHVEALAVLLTSEQGKPLADARSEILGAAFWLKSFAKLELPIHVDEDHAGRRWETRHIPVGVVGAISPWNFPVLLSFFKIAPALAAGNTVVMKPSPYTPLTMLRIGALLGDVLPPGVLNMICGGDQAGPWLTAHPDIDKVSFTGSTPTGKLVLQSAASNLKRVTLELGGNDAAIVLPDVNVAAVAKDLFWAAFRNSGQICVAAKRIYVHADIYDELAAELQVCAAAVVIGEGTDTNAVLGPVQNRMQYKRVLDLIHDCRQNGMRFLTGGEPEPGPGYFISPTIVDNPPEDSRVVREEAFGPLLPLLKYTDIDDAIARANDSEFGLAASIWSGDVEAAVALAPRLEVGTVWINEIQLLSPFHAFAGHKQSGFGVENGLHGMLEYTLPQTITKPGKVER